MGMKKLVCIFILVGWMLLLTAFNLDNAIVPRDEILSGGPPKDGIPALLNPKFIKAGEAHFLEPDDVIIGVASGSQTKAYPIKILNLHEVVNDTINGIPIAVTF